MINLLVFCFIDLFCVAKEVFGRIDIAVDNAAVIHEFNWKLCLDVNVVKCVSYLV